MNGFSDKNDNLLVEMSLLGDESAYEELVVRYEKAVKGTAYKVTGNEFSAEDASQDAFVSAWIKLDCLKDSGKFGSWVCAIAKNCAIDLLKHYKNAASDISFELLENSKLTSDDEKGLSEILNLKNIAQYEKEQKLRDAVESLTYKIRETVKLHYFKELSVAEIAKIQGVAVGTVKWRLNEGRKQLRKEYGIMEKNSDMTFVKKVMHQVEQLKLWSLKNDRTGFEKDYRKVLENIEKLDESTEKQYALADVLIRGYWWIPGEKNDKTFERIKISAEQSHNEEVMQSIMCQEFQKVKSDERLNFMINTQVPYLEKMGFTKTLGCQWFWIGYEYCTHNQKDKGIECYNKVLDILEESDVYYANALSAIYAENKVLTAAENGQPEVSFCATGEVLKFINNKLYFLNQPGYGTGNVLDSAIFWNCSAVDNLMFDKDLKPNEIIVSSDGGNEYKRCAETFTLKVPAGEFENCIKCVITGKYANLNYCEIYFCEGVGIVSQIVTGFKDVQKWELSSYNINGGEGIIPFAKGNRWEYTLSSDDGVKYNIENVFEIVYTNGVTANISSYVCAQRLGYDESSWKGNILKARYEYVTEGDNCLLNDVSSVMNSAAKLASTKRERLHTAIARDVMTRILSTDPKINPTCTKKGRWNFFGYGKLQNSANGVRFHQVREYCFEWKDMGNCDDEGKKIVYSFPFEHLSMWTDYVWSDDWKAGLKTEKEKMIYGKNLKLVFEVLKDQDVTVAAGEFKDCRHLKLNVRGYERGGQQYLNGIKDYWFAKEVGLVKYSSTYKNDSLVAVWQLTDYQGRGEGYFPIKDGLFRRFEPVDLSVGWDASLEYTFDEDENGVVVFKNAVGNSDR